MKKVKTIPYINLLYNCLNTWFWMRTYLNTHFTCNIILCSCCPRKHIPKIRCIGHLVFTSYKELLSKYFKIIMSKRTHGFSGNNYRIAKLLKNDIFPGENIVWYFLCNNMRFYWLNNVIHVRKWLHTVKSNLRNYRISSQWDITIVEIQDKVRGKKTSLKISRMVLILWRLQICFASHISSSQTYHYWNKMYAFLFGFI